MRVCAAWVVAQDGWFQLRDRFLARVGAGTTLVLLVDAGFQDSPEALAAHLGLTEVRSPMLSLCINLILTSPGGWVYIPRSYILP